MKPAMSLTEGEHFRTLAGDALPDVGDAVIGLRLWGSDTILKLPASSSAPVLVGTSRECRIRLPLRMAELEEAQLTFDNDRWSIRSLRTPEGLRHDGVPSPGFVLTPGVEISFGMVTLIAESQRTVRLRAFCQRLLGWDESRRRAVDHALRAIRLAKAHRTPLVICGEGDLVPIAQALHSLTSVGPFVVCDPRRRDTMASVRAPANVPLGIEAFARAAGGALCLRNARLTDNIAEVRRRAYGPHSTVQLIVCARSHHGAWLGSTPAIEIPLLRIREIELSRIVQEYAHDAIRDLEVGSEHFSDEDRDWVLAHCAQSLPEIEKATLRIAAVSASRNLAQAAARLGMAPVSLSRWLDRRPRRALHAEPEPALAQRSSK